MARHKKKSKDDIIQELSQCLQTALYDLEMLNQHDPFYSPRCKARAHNILLEIGVKEIKMPYLRKELLRGQM